MKKILNLFKNFFGWPLSFAAIFFLIQRISSRSASLNIDFKSLDVQILIYGIACFIIYFILRGSVWNEILKARGHLIPFREAIYLWAISELKRYIPGNIWSILGRAVIFSEKGVGKKTIASSMIVEAQYFLLGNLIVSLLASSFVFYNLIPKPFPIEILRICFLLFTAIITLFYVFNQVIFKRITHKYFLILFNHLLPNFGPKNNSFLLVLSVIYSLFFGLGMYFTISSMVFLTPVYILTFIGLFTLSLLTGYLSIITPMGLGVREAVITLGLSKFVSLNFAGMGAIYARIVLIFSEAVFIIFSFLYYNLKNQQLIKIEKIIRNNKYLSLIIFLIIIYCVYFINASIARYEHFYTGRFDLGNMDQTVWNTSQGRIFQFTDPDGTKIISRLAFHADFILVMLTPLYLIWSNPKMLLIFQTIIVALGSIFVFKISKYVLKNDLLSFLISFAFLLNPIIQHAILFDFHAVTLSTTFLLGAFYFFLNKRYFLFLIFATLSAITKEQVWIIISFFGLWIYIRSIKESLFKLNKGKIAGAILFFFCVSIFYYLVSIAIPNARGGSNHFALSYYSDFGNSPFSIIKNALISPDKIFSLILQKDRLNYFFQIFMPGGFLIIFAPQYLIFAMPDLLINLLSNNSQLRQIYFQYNSNIVPFIFISTIFAIKNLIRIFPEIPSMTFGLFLAATTIYSSYSLGPLPATRNPNLDMFVKPQQNKKIIADFIDNIPARFSIASTNNLGSHLSHRQKIFTIPVGLEEADIVLFLLNDPFAQPSPQKQVKMVEELKRNKKYIEVFKQDNFIVFKKRSLYLR